LGAIKGRKNDPRYRQLYRSRGHRHGQDHADGHPARHQRPSRSVGTGCSRRLGTVEDFAKVVEFLPADLSDSVTGSLIPVDGGLFRA
jgi:NAD(P)-dependent dehydrogenase (short-subunit alcohol dehydrogenase family)